MLGIKELRLNVIFIFIIILFRWPFLYADNTISSTQTKNRLKQLNNQIVNLKKILANAHDKRRLLMQELVTTEKQINQGVQRLRIIQKDMNLKREKIISLQRDASKLNQELATQQQQLAEHIRIRYKIGEYQPIKWILNQNDLHTINRFLTFHQYLVNSRQKIIDDLDTTRQNLTQTQDDLKNEIKDQQILQAQLNKHQALLENDKHYHAAVIQSLDNEIQNKQSILIEFEHNKANLSRLLNSLPLQNVSYTKQPFMNMRHKLIPPVHNAYYLLQNKQQGITFFADEGTPVYAVYSGKIVFSDWLNGYGLLLIIDHGQGFMTLYAHNQALFKQIGTSVLQGEQIAAVGHSGGLKQNGLYFEVRQYGKAVYLHDWLS